MTSRIGDTEAALLNEVLDGGFRGPAMGQMTKRLEDAFARRFDVPHAVAVNSGTAALHAACVAAGVGPGDEVIVPALTMAATTFCFVYEGARPVFADVDPHTLTIDPASVAALVGPRTKAVIPVSVYGQAPDYAGLLDVCRTHGLKLIEDNAETMLGTWDGRLVGTIGDLGCFSFQGSKHLTGGEGGMVLCREEALADRLRSFTVMGYDVARAKQGLITKDVLQSPDYARHTDIGVKYRMPDLCAAVVLGQVSRADELIAVRRRSAAALLAALDGCAWLLPQQVPANVEHTYYTLAVRLLLDRVGFTWHDFRRTYMELGGDGIYAAWIPTFAEPVWRVSGDHRVAAVVSDERYAAEPFAEYWAARCPNTVAVQPQILQFKTNYYDPDRLARQADILAETVRRLS